MENLQSKQKSPNMNSQKVKITIGGWVDGLG